MHAKGLELDTHLSSLKALNDELIAKSAKVLEGLTNLIGTVAVAVPSASCHVCYSRPPTHALVPCGHASICINCAERVKSRNRCHVCRGRVSELLKIYL